MRRSSYCGLVAAAGMVPSLAFNANGASVSSRVMSATDGARTTTRSTSRPRMRASVAASMGSTNAVRVSGETPVIWSSVEEPVRSWSGSCAPSPAASREVRSIGTYGAGSSWFDVPLDRGLDARDARREAGVGLRERLPRLERLRADLEREGHRAGALRAGRRCRRGARPVRARRARLRFVDPSASRAGAADDAPDRGQADRVGVGRRRRRIGDDDPGHERRERRVGAQRELERVDAGRHRRVEVRFA